MKWDARIPASAGGGTLAHGRSRRHEDRCLKRWPGSHICGRPNETLAALGTSPYAPAPQRRIRLADVLMPVKVVKRFPISGRGGIGRHAGLRSLCPQRAWRFNSSRPHSSLSLAGSQSSEGAGVLQLQACANQLFSRDTALGTCPRTRL